MRITSLFAIVMLVSLGTACAQNVGNLGAWNAAAAPADKATASTAPSGDPCLLVKHKGTIGRRLAWFFLIGVPIAPGAKFDYVDAVNFRLIKTAYTGKDLQKLQAQGVHVIVLNENFAAADLEAARKACAAPPSAVAEAK
jgi:hypothetical protein